MAGEKGPSPVQLGFADWDQAYNTLEGWKILELES